MPNVIFTLYTPVILIQPTRQATTNAEITIRRQKRVSTRFFLIWTAMTRVDFSNLYRKKGGCIFVLFLFLFLLFSPKPGF